MVKTIIRPYQFKKVVMADLHFGGWTEIEEALIADCIIACIQRGYPSDLEALKRYNSHLNKDASDEKK